MCYGEGTTRQTAEHETITPKNTESNSDYFIKLCNVIKFLVYLCVGAEGMKIDENGGDEGEGEG